MTTTKRNWMSPKMLLIAATLLVLLVMSNRILKAFNPQPDPPGVYGIMGITPSDTMRINVVNVQIAGSPPDPCSVTFRFLSAAGTILKAQTVTVKSTQSAFLDMTGAEAGGAFRNQIHPAMLLSNNNGVGCSAVGSVEIFNSASGETTVFTQPVFIPPPSAVN